MDSFNDSMKRGNYLSFMGIFVFNVEDDWMSFSNAIGMMAAFLGGQGPEH